jgi:hypothetical protein
VVRHLEDGQRLKPQNHPNWSSVPCEPGATSGCSSIAKSSTGSTRTDPTRTAIPIPASRREIISGILVKGMRKERGQDYR